MLIKTFNPTTDTVEYLNLISKNMKVIRGSFLHLLSGEKDAEQLELFLKQDKTKVFTLKSEKQIVGFTVYTLHGDILFIEQLHLKPDFRGRGLGTRALEFLEAQAKMASCVAMELEVYKKNPARCLYENSGFQTTGFYKKIWWWIYTMRKTF